MKKLAKIGIIIFVIILYVPLINLFASLINFSSQGQSISSVISGGFNVRIGVSDSVGIKVTRTRFYGTIIISNGFEHLYLFNLIKLPKKIQQYNFMIFHLIFLTTITLFTILIFTKKKVYKEEATTSNYESLVENPLDKS